jgi:hypothetical protein
MLFKLVEGDPRVCGYGLMFCVVGVDKFDTNSIDLILELSWPVEVVGIWFNKEDLALENTNAIT